MATLLDFTAACDKWAKVAGVGHYNITYHEDAGIDDVAETFIHPAYFDAEIVFNPVAFDEQAPEAQDLDALARHEVAHIIVSSHIQEIVFDLIHEVSQDKAEVYTRWWKASNERLTEHVGRMIGKMSS